jgi:hypothetical protein
MVAAASMPRKRPSNAAKSVRPTAALFGFLPAIPKLLQIGGDGGIELRGVGLLLA